MTYDQAKDDPRGALRFLSMILAAHGGNTPMAEARLQKAFHLLGTLALAAGIDADTIRAEMTVGIPEMADSWYNDFICEQLSAPR